MLLIFTFMLYKNILAVGCCMDLGIKTQKLMVCKYFILYIFKRKRIKTLTDGSRKAIFRDLAKNKLKSVPFYGQKTRRNSQRVYFLLTCLYCATYIGFSQNAILGLKNPFEGVGKGFWGLFGPDGGCGKAFWVTKIGILEVGKWAIYIFSAAAKNWGRSLAVIGSQRTIFLALPECRMNAW